MRRWHRPVPLRLRSCAHFQSLERYFIQLRRRVACPVLSWSLNLTAHSRGASAKHIILLCYISSIPPPGLNSYDVAENAIVVGLIIACYATDNTKRRSTFAKHGMQVRNKLLRLLACGEVPTTVVFRFKDNVPHRMHPSAWSSHRCGSVIVTTHRLKAWLLLTFSEDIRVPWGTKTHHLESHTTGRKHWDGHLSSLLRSIFSLTLRAPPSKTNRLKPMSRLAPSVNIVRHLSARKCRNVPSSSSQG